jgi:hypothetical protein
VTGGDDAHGLGHRRLDLGRLGAQAQPALHHDVIEQEQDRLLQVDTVAQVFGQPAQDGVLVLVEPHQRRQPRHVALLARQIGKSHGRRVPVRDRH